MGSPKYEASSTPTQVHQELLAREPIFHHPEFGTSRADFAAMIVDDYWEIGASGRRYEREFILDVLAERLRQPPADEWAIEDFAVRQLGAKVHLATYTLWQGRRQTRRATVWERTGDSWRALYHQGTIVESDPSRPVSTGESAVARAVRPP